MRHRSWAAQAFVTAFFGWLVCFAPAMLRADAQEPSLQNVQKKFAGKKGLAYTRALFRLGKNSQLSLFERHRALKQALRQAKKLKRPRPRLLAKISLAQAEIEGMRMRWSRRRGFLRQAEKYLVKAGRKQRAHMIALLRKAEAILPRLARASQRAGTKKRALRKSEQRLIGQANELMSREHSLRQRNVELLLRAWALPLRMIDLEADAAKEQTDLVALHDKLLAQPRLAAVHKKLLFWAAGFFATQQDWHQAAKWAVSADHLRALKASQARRDLPALGQYCRSPRSRQLCALARQAQVDCLSIERQRFHQSCFFDYSQGPTSPAFDPQLASEVLADYSPLLRGCLVRAAEKGELAPGAKVELSWTPKHDGQVSDVQIRPHRYLGGAYEKCVRASFARFRYPPYRGELQHIALQFRVND